MNKKFIFLVKSLKLQNGRTLYKKNLLCSNECYRREKNNEKKDNFMVFHIVKKKVFDKLFVIELDYIDEETLSVGS